MSTLSVILTALATILASGNVAQFFMVKNLKAKSTAETESMQIGSMQTVIKTLEEQVKRLDAENQDLRNRVNELQKIINQLHIN